MSQWVKLPGRAGVAHYVIRRLCRVFGTRWVPLAEAGTPCNAVESTALIYNIQNHPEFSMGLDFDKYSVSLYRFVTIFLFNIPITLVLWPER